VIAVSVAAVRGNGKSNTALLKMLAKSLGIPKKSPSICVGGKGRSKTIFVISLGAEFFFRHIDIVLNRDPMAEAKIIDGKALAANIHASIKLKVSNLKNTHRITPKLAVILVGEAPASRIYVRNKDKALVRVGMGSQQYNLAEDTGEKKLLTLIESLNADSNIHGILVQLPLPSHISVDTIINAIDPEKDVDGFSVTNIGRRVAGVKTAIIPCTPLGCMLMLKDNLGDLSGLHALVIGRSSIVGMPMLSLLVNASCTATVAHSKTEDLPEECLRADILIAAIVIDVGINRVPLANGKFRLVGDVEFDEAKKKAKAITPVPGGVGPMTIACLLQNTLDAACRQNGLYAPSEGEKLIKL
jgi:methylenetetrahydrofolate dehydrogenase (NADP+)/methenyltetrahydrofolate cyclohydrolase